MAKVIIREGPHSWTQGQLSFLKQFVSQDKTVGEISHFLKIPPLEVEKQMKLLGLYALPPEPVLPDESPINENDFRYIMETREGAEAIWDERLAGRRFDRR